MLDLSPIMCTSGSQLHLENCIIIRAFFDVSIEIFENFEDWREFEILAYQQQTILWKQ